MDPLLPSSINDRMDKAYRRGFRTGAVVGFISATVSAILQRWLF